jgi:hypothetical protein
MSTNMNSLALALFALGILGLVFQEVARRVDEKNNEYKPSSGLRLFVFVLAIAGMIISFVMQTLEDREAAGRHALQMQSHQSTFNAVESGDAREQLHSRQLLAIENLWDLQHQADRIFDIFQQQRILVLSALFPSLEELHESADRANLMRAEYAQYLAPASQTCLAAVRTIIQKFNEAVPGGVRSVRDSEAKADSALIRFKDVLSLSNSGESEIEIAWDGLFGQIKALKDSLGEACRDARTQISKGTHELVGQWRAELGLSKSVK